MTPGSTDIKASTRALPIKFFCILFCLFFVSGAGAASLSLVPTSSVEDVQPGDLVTFDIEVDFTGDPPIQGSFDIKFDSSALQFVGLSVDPDYGDPGFHRDPDVLDGVLLGWCEGDFNGLPPTGTLGNVTFEVLPTMGAETDVGARDTEYVPCGPWISATTFMEIWVDYFGFSVDALDTDGDGDPNHSDCDDDNDDIRDSLDTDPLVANNVCTTRNGDAATVAETIVGDLSCAAEASVNVDGPTKVMGGNLTVISPSIRVFDEVEVDGGMTLINANPGC